MRVRRSPHLVAFWRRGSLVATNYATRTTAPITPFVCELLDGCEDWISVAQLARRIAVPADASLTSLIEQLVSLDLIERAGRKVDPRVTAMSELSAWNPEAGFFHAATRDVRFVTTRVAARQARLQAEHWPMPPVVKRYRGAQRIALAKPRADSEFTGILRARRTWRRFSKRPVSLDDLATLLGLTSGVQQWVQAGPDRLALKTSPSGGARHSIETYVVVRDVAGVRPGVYHYAADSHALERIGGRVPIQRLRDYLPNSGYFAEASAMVFFTAVFARIYWRYPYSRAYRAALVEAGHLCQTFCLTATWLRLAPYCVLGLADSLIERDLGLDGIREAVLYAAGVGRPPRGSSWAPRPRGSLVARKNPRL